MVGLRLNGQFIRLLSFWKLSRGPRRVFGVGAAAQVVFHTCIRIVATTWDMVVRVSSSWSKRRFALCKGPLSGSPGACKSCFFSVAFAKS
jgi:hypothetical protein